MIFLFFRLPASILPSSLPQVHPCYQIVLPNLSVNLSCDGSIIKCGGLSKLNEINVQKELLKYENENIR